MNRSNCPTGPTRPSAATDSQRPARGRSNSPYTCTAPVSETNTPSQPPTPTAAEASYTGAVSKLAHAGATRPPSQPSCRRRRRRRRYRRRRECPRAHTRNHGPANQKPTTQQTHSSRTKAPQQKRTQESYADTEQGGQSNRPRGPVPDCPCSPLYWEGDLDCPKTRCTECSCGWQPD